jgi:hypothetical protein
LKQKYLGILSRLNNQQSPCQKDILLESQEILKSRKKIPVFIVHFSELYDNFLETISKCSKLLPKLGAMLYTKALTLGN